jgi:hypothetical protein
VRVGVLPLGWLNVLSEWTRLTAVDGLKGATFCRYQRSPFLPVAG